MLTAEPDRLQPLLLGLHLHSRRVVAVGAGAVAARRVQQYLDAGADVTVIAPDAHPRIAELAAAGRLTWRRRSFRTGDLAGAWLVHTATGDTHVDEQVCQQAAGTQTWCVHAGDAAATTVSTPARGTLRADDGTVTVAVLSGDPRRSASVRDRVIALMRSGVVPLQRTRKRVA